jgi:hypothetical protein
MTVSFSRDSLYPSLRFRGCVRSKLPCHLFSFGAAPGIPLVVWIELLGGEHDSLAGAVSGDSFGSHGAMRFYSVSVRKRVAQVTCLLVSKIFP